MHPKNIPITIGAALCLGTVVAYTFFYGEGDLMLLWFIFAASILSGILAISITKRDIITPEEFETLFGRILAEIEAHRKDHSVRAYNPKQVGVQLASLTASIVQLDTLLRERIGRNVKKVDDAVGQS